MPSANLALPDFAYNEAGGPTGWAADLITALGKLDAAHGVSAKSFGGLKGDMSDDTAAFNSMMAALAAQPTKLFDVHWEPGTYSLTPAGFGSSMVIPWNVRSFRPVHDRAATLFNADTHSTTFLSAIGNRFSCRGMVIDANRAGNIAWGTANHHMDNFLAIGMSKPASNTGTGGAVVAAAGGLILAAAITAGATSITTTLPYCGTTVPCYIQPGDVICVTDGTNYERLRVASTFVVGNTSGGGGSCSIPICGTTVNAFATTAHATLAATGVDVADNTFFGAGVQVGGTADGCMVTRNRFYDQVDTTLGHFDRGGRQCFWTDNIVETYSFWGIVIDDFSQSLAVYPPNEDNVVARNSMTFLPGGPDIGDSVGAGNIDLVCITGATRTLVEGNVLDLRRSQVGGSGHIAGVRINPLGKDTRCLGNTIVGANQANSYGVIVILLTGTDLSADVQVSGGHIEGCNIGVDLGNAKRCQVTGVKFRGCANNAVNQTSSRTDGAVMLHTIDGNDIDGGTTAIRLATAGTVPAGSGYVGNNTITGATTPLSLAGGYVHNPAGQTS